MAKGGQNGGEEGVNWAGRGRNAVGSLQQMDLAVNAYTGSYPPFLLPIFATQTCTSEIVGAGLMKVRVSLISHLKPLALLFPTLDTMHAFLAQLHLQREERIVP